MLLTESSDYTHLLKLDPARGVGHLRIGEWTHAGGRAHALSF
jgi:hypothetical protein